MTMQAPVNPGEMANPISFGPDVLSQLLYVRTHGHSELAVPEKALMFAVLAEAVETYQKCAFATSRRRRSLFRDVEEWFLKNESDHLFSFRVVCDVLGFDPLSIRGGLLRWTENHRENHALRKNTQLHSVRSRARRPLGSATKRASRRSTPAVSLRN